MTDKISPEELREIGLEVEGQSANVREPVHACMTCRFRIRGTGFYDLDGDGAWDRCGARGGMVITRGSKSINLNADCSVWEAIPQRAIARRSSSEIARSYPPIVHVVKWISIAFIVWVVF